MHKLQTVLNTFIFAYIELYINMNILWNWELIKLNKIINNENHTSGYAVILFYDDNRINKIENMYTSSQTWVLQ